MRVRSGRALHARRGEAALDGALLDGPVGFALVEQRSAASDPSAPEQFGLLREELGALGRRLSGAPLAFVSAPNVRDESGDLATACTWASTRCGSRRPSLTAPTPCRSSCFRPKSSAPPIRAGARAASSTPARASTDVMPTLLDMLEIPDVLGGDGLPEWRAGTLLVPLMLGQLAIVRQVAVSQYWSQNPEPKRSVMGYSMRTMRRRFVVQMAMGLST